MRILASPLHLVLDCAWLQSKWIWSFNEKFVRRKIFKLDQNMLPQDAYAKYNWIKSYAATTPLTSERGKFRFFFLHWIHHSIYDIRIGIFDWTNFVQCSFRMHHLTWRQLEYEDLKTLTKCGKRLEKQLGECESISALLKLSFMTHKWRDQPWH